MEELKRLAKEYYKNTIQIRFFGIGGILCLLFSVPFLVLSLYINFSVPRGSLVAVPMFIGVGLWVFARSIYDKNLVRSLAYFTHSESKSVTEQKAAYLQYLTSHVGSSLFVVMKSFSEILEEDSKHKVYVLDNGWRHFLTFLYDPDSKNRILSLLIYLISLIAILTVIKPDTEVEIYALIADITAEQLWTFVFWTAVGIVFAYVLIVLPLRFIVKFMLLPLFLSFPSSTMLSRHFMSN